MTSADIFCSAARAMSLLSLCDSSDLCSPISRDIKPVTCLMLWLNGV